MLFNYHTLHGVQTALIAEKGTKYLHLIIITGRGVRLSKVKLAESKYLRVIDDGPDALLAGYYLDVGDRLGITLGAKRALENMVNGGGDVCI